MNGTARIRVFSADGHPLFREGIAAIINNELDMLMVGQVSTGREAVRRFREDQPDVMLMDLRLPDMTGVEALLAIRREFPEARIVMLTKLEGDVEIQRALTAGARGYVFKNIPPQELTGVIRGVYAGRKQMSADVLAKLAEHIGDEHLTERELTILRHVAEGNRNRDIASRLSISEQTVKVHITRILGKLGATDRTQAVAISVRRGIIHL